MNQPAISAIVVSYQTGPRLKECLFALIADPNVAEIIIVDNGNPNAMTSWLAAFEAARPDVHRVFGQGNIGFGAGVNRGNARAKGPHLLVINPDAVLRWNSLPGMQDVASDCEAPWIIGGKIFDIHGREERGGRRKELTLGRVVSRLIGWNTWTLEHTPPPREPLDMPVISGAFFLTSKDSMARLGGFDEGYFLHVEDVDICRRCREEGGRVIYDPRAAALHYGSTSEAPNGVIAAHKADSLAYYFRKFASSALERMVIAMTLPFIRLAVRLRSR